MSGPSSNARSVSAELNELPESKDFPATLSLFESIPRDQLRYPLVVEQLFTALFYNYLWAEPSQAAFEAWLGAPFVHAVINTPHRKFKASLPWLSVTCNPAAALDCLCTEALSSLFYLLDDIYDGKSKRYGKQTAYGIYGAWGNRNTLNRAFNFDPKLAPIFQDDPDRADLWLNSLNQIQTSEDERLTYYETLPLPGYRQQSIQRTSFLGKWWKRVALKAQDLELARVVETIYPLCADIGQIRNDLRNTESREEEEGGIRFSDFTDGRSTAVTILVRQRISGRDGAWLENVIWNRKQRLPSESCERIQWLCKDLQVREDLRDEMSRNVQKIEGVIERSHLSEAVKAIWLGWVFRQLHTEVPFYQPEYTLEVNRFLDGARYLSRYLTGDAHATEPIVALHR